MLLPENKGIDRIDILNFTLYLLILYSLFPYLIRLLSGIFFSKLPLAIGFILSTFFIILIATKRTFKIKMKYFYFLLYQLSIWSYFSVSSTINAIIHNYPTKYILASTFSYTLIPTFIILFSVIFSNIERYEKKNSSIVITLILLVIFTPALLENIIFYTNGIDSFKSLKEKKIITSYYISILNQSFLKTFSIFSSGLEFGFLSLLLYIFLDSSQKVKRNYFNSTLRLLCLLGIILSFTRIVWITFMLYYILAFLLRKCKPRLLTILLIQLFLNVAIAYIIYLSVLYISKVDIYFVNSIITRFRSWYEILLFIKEKFNYFNYLFGYGISQTEVWNPFNTTKYNVFCIDNTFLNLFLIGGFLAIFLFIVNYYMILKMLLKIYKAQSQDKKHIFNLIVLWIIFPLIMHLNVLIPSILFMVLYGNSLYIINLYNRKY